MAETPADRARLPRRRSVDFADPTEETPLQRGRCTPPPGRSRCNTPPGRARSRSPRHSVVVHDHRGGREVIAMVDVGLQAAPVLPTEDREGIRRLVLDPVFVITCSVWINLALFIVKVYIWIQTGSLAVLASVVDSLIDLLAQGVLVWAKRLSMSEEANKEYPVGRSRLEPVGVIVCAVLMGMASMEVIHKSIQKIETHWGETNLHLAVNVVTTSMLVAVVILKSVLYRWSDKVAKMTNDETVKAVATDNLNDVLSNACAVVAVVLTLLGGAMWLSDPIMGILISVYIVYTWLVTAHEQVDMLVGKKADHEFLQRVRDMAEQLGKEQGMQLDSMEAYHFGPKYLVELEMVMPEDTQLGVSHDAGMRLQHTIEANEEMCERCFVHIDYQTRVGADGKSIDHDPKVPLEEKLHCPSPHSQPCPRQAAGQRHGLL
eukprot:TRINITY_DN18407_c0_g1_i1.p1 TRINITY_DN18407_c0_g1~~TRINITY_DN18407_c0_g1_i1.p1  ORF type:complete len:466 (+),score=129.38 TRINITY_DN18407_c0_g1_i1:103-1398(+)